MTSFAASPSSSFAVLEGDILLGKRKEDKSMSSGGGSNVSESPEKLV